MQNFIPAAITSTYKWTCIGYTVITYFSFLHYTFYTVVYGSHMYNNVYTNLVFIPSLMLYEPDISQWHFTHNTLEAIRVPALGQSTYNTPGGKLPCEAQSYKCCTTMLFVTSSPHPAQQGAYNAW